MPKMKDLLRRLHIGQDRLADQQRAPVETAAAANPPASPPPPVNSSSSPASASSSGSPSVSDSGASRCDPAGGGGGFSLFEEEYQVRLAMALSASDTAGVEDLDSVQIKAAKRMSLVTSAAEEFSGSSAGGGEGSLMEGLSLRYWEFLPMPGVPWTPDSSIEDFGSKWRRWMHQVNSATVQVFGLVEKILWGFVVVNRKSETLINNLC